MSDNNHTPKDKGGSPVDTPIGRTLSTSSEARKTPELTRQYSGFYTKEKHSGEYSPPVEDDNVSNEPYTLPMHKEESDSPPNSTSYPTLSASQESFQTSSSLLRENSNPMSNEIYVDSIPPPMMPPTHLGDPSVTGKVHFFNPSNPYKKVETKRSTPPVSAAGNMPSMPAPPLPHTTQQAIPPPPPHVTNAGISSSIRQSQPLVKEFPPSITRNLMNRDRDRDHHSSHVSNSSSTNHSHQQQQVAQSAEEDGKANSPPPPQSRRHLTPTRRRNEGKSPPRGRIDSSQMPRPQPSLTDIIFHTRAGTSRKVPPLTTNDFIAIDCGNCSPRYIRSTLCAPPSNRDVYENVKIPFAILATPFANPENGEDEVPLVEIGLDTYRNPPRCSRCKGYINPHVNWFENGEKWKCNLCGTMNQVEAWYYGSLDGSQLRIDRAVRPELSCGSVEFKVSKDYCFKPIENPVIVFVIDVSVEAAISGVLHASLEAIRKSIQELEMHEKVRVGIVSFSQKIHFYAFHQGATEPIRLLLVDPEEPYAPLPDDCWLLNVSKHKDALEKIIGLIAEIFTGEATSPSQCPPSQPNSQAPNSYNKTGPLSSNTLENGIRSPPTATPWIPPFCCPTAAIKATQLGLESIGGRIILISSSSADIGYGKLKRNIKHSVYGTDTEFQYYSYLEKAIELSKSNEEKAAMKLYVTLGDVCTSQGICIDTYLLVPSLNIQKEKHAIHPGGKPPGFGIENCAAFAELTRRTGGSLHVFSGSLLLEDNIYRLQSEIENSINEIAGNDVMMKLRCSYGIQIDEYIGSGIYSVYNSEVKLGGIDNNLTVCYSLRTDLSIKDGEPIYLQLAVLYTKYPTGDRIVRVHNLQLMSTTDLACMFRNTDPDAVTAALCKIAAHKALSSSLSLETEHDGNSSPGAPPPSGLHQLTSSLSTAIKSMQFTGTQLAILKTNARQYLVNSCFEILHTYRIKCSYNSPKGQLILPETLKTLPLFILCLLKHPALLENGATKLSQLRLAVDCCERAYALNRFLTITPREIIRCLYPRLYLLSELKDGEGFPETDADLKFNPPRVKLPAWLKCSAESIESSGIFLLDDGTVLWLYVGRAVSQQMIHDLFGLAPGAELPTSGKDNHEIIPPALSPTTDDARRLSRIVEYLRHSLSIRPELKILWGGDVRPNEGDLLRFGLRLVEDSIYGSMSYVDFLCTTHSKISKSIESNTS